MSLGFSCTLITGTKPLLFFLFLITWIVFAYSFSFSELLCYKCVFVFNIELDLALLVNLKIFFFSNWWTRLVTCIDMIDIFSVNFVIILWYWVYYTLSIIFLLYVRCLLSSFKRFHWYLESLYFLSLLVSLYQLSVEPLVSCFLT